MGTAETTANELMEEFGDCIEECEQADDPILREFARVIRDAAMDYS